MVNSWVSLRASSLQKLDMGLTRCKWCARTIDLGLGSSDFGRDSHMRRILWWLPLLCLANSSRLALLGGTIVVLIEFKRFSYFEGNVGAPVAVQPKENKKNMDNGSEAHGCDAHSSMHIHTPDQRGQIDVSVPVHQAPLPTRCQRGPRGSYANRRIPNGEQQNVDEPSTSRSRSRRIQRVQQQIEDGPSTSRCRSRRAQRREQQNVDGTSTSRPRHSRRRQKRIDPRAAVDKTLPSTPHLLEPQDPCIHCGAFKFQYESPGFCCSSGEVKVSIHDGPKELVDLFRGNDADSQNFQTYSRLFNNMFAFSSLGGHVTTENAHHIYVFKLHGQLYHFLPNLMPDQHNPRYLQLYFYDAVHEHEIRSGQFPNLRPAVVAKLIDISRANPYAQFFRNLHNRDIDETTTIRINKNPMLDQRVYNVPSSSEVAAVLLDSSTSSESDGPYIVVSGRGNTTHRIRYYYGCYDPLQYPLLFPHGESGWRPGLPRYKRNGLRPSAQPTSPIRVADSVEDILTQEEH